VTAVTETVRPSLLLSATVALWAAQVLGLVGGLARSKFNALYLGPDGVGLVSQLNYLSVLIASVAVFGMWNGCIKLLAEARARGDAEQEARVRSITLFYPLAGGLFAAVVVAALATPVGHVLFGVNPHSGAVIVAAFSVPFGLLAAALSIGLQGQGRMHRLAVANSVVALGNTALVIGLVVVFGLPGAIAGVLLTSVLTAVVFVIREPGLFRGVSFRFQAILDRKVLRAIYAFGVAAIILSISAAGIDLGVRTLIVHRLGIPSNGLYQPVTMLSTQLFLALISALSIYLFPRLTGLYADGQHEEATAEVNRGIRLMLVAAVPAVILTITLAPLLLRLVFSKQFVSAQSALTWQMGGEVFRALAWTVGAVLLPLGLIRIWLGIGLLTLAVQAGLVVALIGPFGLVGVSVAYSSSWLVNAAVAIVVAYRLAQFRLNPMVFRMVVGALLFIAASMGVARLSGRVVPVAGICLFASWVALTTRRDSLQALATTVRSFRR
jgi:enterobacterial common antigen flippase